jgi:hypothetical protein
VQWFKSYVNLRNNPIYRRLTPLARNAFDNAMRTAADYDQNGALSTRIGPLNDDELSHDLIVPATKLASVLAELIGSSLLRRDENGVLWVEKFSAKTESSASRQKRYRARKRLERDANVTCDGDVTRNVTSDGVTVDVTVTDNEVTGEIEEEIRTSTNVDGAGRQPNDVWDFSLWLRSEAVAVNLLSATDEKATAKALRADLADASSLLQSHGRPECELRAKRMLEALATGEISRGLPTVRHLAKVWDWKCVATGKVTPLRVLEPAPFRPERIFR